MALCPPNGGDNLAFQCAAALCNSGTPALQQAYGYVGIAAFVSSFNAAAKASNNNWGLIHMILSGMNQDNPNQAAFCGGKPTKVDCSQYPNNCSG
jgi:hypothetical protein